MSKPNFVVLDTAIEWAEREQAAAAQEARVCLYDPRQWGIEIADCGTAHCLAGHIVAAAGFRPASRDWSQVYDPLVDENEYGGRFWPLPTSEVSDMLLNLGDTTFGNLDFYGETLTLDDIKLKRDQLARRHHVRARWHTREQLVAAEEEEDDEA
jgi:hypothetical protein